MLPMLPDTIYESHRALKMDIIVANHLLANEDIYANPTLWQDRLERF